MRAAPLRQYGVHHPPPDILDTCAASLSLRQQRVVQIRQGEDQHAIAVPVQSRQVRVLVASTLRHHLDGERLPRGVGGPPALVDRRRRTELPLEIVVRTRLHPPVDLVLQVGGGLEHMKQVTREVCGSRFAPARPVRKAAVLALEELKLLQCLLDGRAHLRGVEAGKRERVAKIRGQQQGQRT